MDLPPLTKIKITWTDPREGEGQGGGPKSGTQEFDLYDPASLAMELYIARGGEVEQYRFMDGGPLYLIGEPHLFWPMVINFKRTGSCCPPLRPPPLDAERGPLLLDHTVPAMGMAQALMYMQNIGRGLGPGPTEMRFQSRSLAQTSLMRKKDPAYFPPKFCDFGEEVALPIDREILETEFKWWVEAATPWDNLLSVMAEAPEDVGHMPCMFYCTEIGCMSERVGECLYRHDPAWKKEVKDLEANPRVCGVCKRYASTRCGRCRGEFYCARACQKKGWKKHEDVCKEPTTE